MLRPPTEVLDSPRDFPGSCVDCGDTLAAAICAEHPFRLLIENDAIRIVTDNDPVQDFQVLQVENQNGPRIAATDEAPAKLSRDRDTMNALAGNLTDDRVCVKINHDHLSIMGHIQSSAFRIGRQVIPAVIPWYRELRYQVVRIGRAANECKHEESRRQSERRPP